MEPDDLLERIDDVRLLIADLDEANRVFDDLQLTQLLRLEDYHVKRGAALALETYASHIAQVAGPVRGLLDIRIGGEQSAATLRAVASAWRSQSPRAVGVTKTPVP